MTPYASPFDWALFLAAFGVGTSSLLAVLILRNFYTVRAARIFALLLATAIVHWLHPWLPKSLEGLSFIIQSAAPALFWMFCRFTFIEPDESRYFLWPIAFYSFLAPLSFLLIGQPDALLFTFKGLPQWMEYFLIVAGFWEVANNWQSDLVEERRRLRAGVIFGLGLTVGWAIISFNLHLGNVHLRFLGVDIAIVILAWILLSPRADVWQSAIKHAPLAVDNPLPEPEAFSLSADDQESLSQLRQLMNQGFYRHENLSLAVLAQQLELPEYRLRAIINKALAYSNFNEYINVLRIGEATERLLKEPATPITNIALDVGYRTMSSFNRAFRKIHQQSPSEYRESHQH